MVESLSAIQRRLISVGRFVVASLVGRPFALQRTVPSSGEWLPREGRGLPRVGPRLQVKARTPWAPDRRSLRKGRPLPPVDGALLATGRGVRPLAKCSPNGPACRPRGGGAVASVVGRWGAEKSRWGPGFVGGRLPGGVTRLAGRRAGAPAHRLSGTPGREEQPHAGREVGGLGLGDRIREKRQPRRGLIGRVRLPAPPQIERPAGTPCGPFFVGCHSGCHRGHPRGDPHDRQRPLRRGAATARGSGGRTAENRGPQRKRRRRMSGQVG